MIGEHDDPHPPASGRAQVAPAARATAHRLGTAEGSSAFTGCQAVVAPDAPELIRVAKRGGVPAIAPAAAPGVTADQIRFRVSSEDEDSFGDVVVQEGLDFPTPLPAVADHSHAIDAAVGDWRDVERRGPETFATLRLLPKGVSRVADLVRALHAGGYPIASSVYFDIARNDIRPILKAGTDGRLVETGKRYMRGRVREITLTQFPANPAAVAVARSLGFNDAELAALSRTVPAPASVSRASLAVAGAPASKGRTMTTLSELLTAAQAANDVAQATYERARQAMEADASEANIEAVARSATDASALLSRLAGLQAAESLAARRAAGTPAPAAAAPTPVSRSVVDLGAAQTVARAGAPALIRGGLKSTQDLAPGTRLARMAIACSLAKEHRRGVDDVALELYPNDPEMLAIARTAVGVADTSTSGWASELVRSETRQMLDETLKVTSVWAALASLGTSLNFGGAMSTLIPQMNVGTTVGGAWVGEGGVIPLARTTISSKRLYAYKLAGIVPITKELQRASDPSAVEAMRKLIAQFLSNLLDSSMMDTSAEVTGVRPAGLLNSVTPIAGTAGGGYNALQKDLQAVVDAFITAGVGTKPVLLVNAGKAFSLRTMQNALGQFVFPDGSNSVLSIPVIASQFVTAGTAVVVDADKFASAIDNMEFDLSEQATLTMSNADGVAPTQAGATALGGALGTANQVVRDGGIPIAGATGASTTGYTAISLWQTWSLGIRLVVPASFGITRTGAVQALSAITW